MAAAMFRTTSRLRPIQNNFDHYLAWRPLFTRTPLVMTPSTTGTGPRSVRSISAHSLVRGHHLSWRRARPAQGLDLSAESQLIRLRRPLSRRRRIDQRRL